MVFSFILRSVCRKNANSRRSNFCSKIRRSGRRRSRAILMLKLIEWICASHVSFCIWNMYAILDLWVSCGIVGFQAFLLAPPTHSSYRMDNLLLFLCISTESVFLGIACLVFSHPSVSFAWLSLLKVACPVFLHIFAPLFFTGLRVWSSRIRLACWRIMLYISQQSTLW